ncbi:MAG: cytochrome c biogenesis protein CcdA [Deltaproteobacteria bacterium]|nr:MAG: cytochrome c biogenesis protein CcdA [Deltaproteobacteria bacterium]
MSPGQNISLLVAFVAGLFSFATPCVLPLFPSYLSFITGISFEELKGDNTRVKRLTIIHSLLFILGFSIVFISLGASATFLGQILLKNQELVGKVGGILIVFFGLYLTGFLDIETEKRLLGLLAIIVALYLTGLFGREFQGLFKHLAIPLALLYGLVALGVIDLNFLLREKKIQLRNKPLGYLGSVLVGITFAAGWTPCIGPILASILTLAVSEGKVTTGVLLLSSYSLGLGIPFFVSSLALNSFLDYFNKVKGSLGLVNIICGVILILVGSFIYLNYLSFLSQMLKKAF